MTWRLAASKEKKANMSGYSEYITAQETIVDYNRVAEQKKTSEILEVFFWS
jgi:hypothetical protein